MNPYKILGIDNNENASPGEILQATGKALREKKYSAREIAIAQKMLMNPKSRALLEDGLEKTKQ